MRLKASAERGGGGSLASVAQPSGSPRRAVPGPSWLAQAFLGQLAAWQGFTGNAHGEELSPGQEGRQAGWQGGADRGPGAGCGLGPVAPGSREPWGTAVGPEPLPPYL